MEIKIDRDLKKLIPPLTNDEYSTLEESIKEEGCRDAIVLWNNTIIDGHNRFEICNKHKITFKTINKTFKDITSVKIWIIDNQNGRRNLTDGWKYDLAQKKKELLLEIGKNKKIESGKETGRGNKKVLSDVDKTFKHNTQKELAKDLGWSTGKLATADVVWKKAPEEIKEQVKKGEKTFNEAYSEIKKKERTEKVNKQIEEIKKDNINKPSGLYDVIVVDPPWKVDFDYSPDHYMGRVANPYPDMDVEQIKKIKLPCKDSSILWLWTTHSQIWNAIKIMEHWGFEYKCILVWDKESMGIGKWLRKQCEFCLLGIKGKPIWTATDFRDIINEKRTNHSSKPELFYKMVDKYCVGRKLDYFARKKREGWSSFGDEIK